MHFHLFFGAIQSFSDIQIQTFDAKPHQEGFTFEITVHLRRDSIRTLYCVIYYLNHVYETIRTKENVR